MYATTKAKRIMLNGEPLFSFESVVDIEYVCTQLMFFFKTDLESSGEDPCDNDIATMHSSPWNTRGHGWMLEVVHHCCQCQHSIRHRMQEPSLSELKRRRTALCTSSTATRKRTLGGTPWLFL